MISRTHTFWRFAIQIPLGEHEISVKYSLNHGQDLEFYVPGRNQNMRWAAHSVCDRSHSIHGGKTDTHRSAMDLVPVLTLMISVDLDSNLDMILYGQTCCQNMQTNHFTHW